MRTLVAILFPPLAVLFTGRPFSAVLNILFTACLWFPGVIHALIVQSQDDTERRHAELLSATTGRAIKPRVSPEKQVAMALLTLAGTAAAGVMLASLVFPERFKPGAVKTSRVDLVDEVKAVEPAKAGEAYAVIAARFGEPVSKDKSTGWAVWSSFRARFDTGVCVEVAP